MPRKASIGPAVYQRVNELTAEGKSRTEAFQQVAQERGMNPGTVAANFYRIARSQSGAQPKRARAKANRRTASSTKRARRSPTRASTSRPAAANGDLSALANQIGDLVQQLVRQVEERDRRLRQLLS